MRGRGHGDHAQALARGGSVSMATGSLRSRVRAAELAGHVLLGFLESHASGHLHAGHQISGCPHPAHAGRLRVGRLHPEGVARARLEPVDLEDLDEGLGGPARGVGRRIHAVRARRRRPCPR